MSNGMELEQDLLADMYGTLLINDPPTDSVEFVKNHFDPIDYESDVQEGTEMTEAQEPTLIILSDGIKKSPLKPNQGFQQEVGYDLI